MRRFSVRPVLTLRGRKFKGLRGWAGKHTSEEDVFPGQHDPLASLVRDGVRGVTANPTIFAKAIEGSDAYDDQFTALAATGRTVLDAYLSGLERLAQQGGDLAAVRSVASFFVSRVDTEVDRRLGAIATKAPARTGR